MSPLDDIIGEVVSRAICAAWALAWRLVMPWTARTVRWAARSLRALADWAARPKKEKTANVVWCLKLPVSAD